ncbi:MAG TPA: GAF domain-containing protein [Holophagaceae bacterium]|nr:GAF domain-containing protein [Holophagaceae bacterium]
MADIPTAPHRLPGKEPKEGGAVESDHLTALAALLDKVYSDSTQLFDHCLGLLIRQLKAQRVMMTRLTELGFEPFWWAHDPDTTVASAVAGEAGGLSARVLDHPRRLLVVRDVQADPHFRDDEECKRLGIRAFMGVALKQGGQATGVLTVHCSSPRAFTPGEVSLVNAVANLLGKTLEVEALRHELRLTRDALELTSAVVEDSALQSQQTGLPNGRYLDIWLKANLFMARRKGEGLGLLMWGLRPGDAEKKKIQALAAAFRGEDLLVDYGRGRLLAILPRTDIAGAESLLARIHPWIEGHPLGATLWDPQRDDPQLQRALSRVEEGMRQAPGEGGVYWNLLS